MAEFRILRRRKVGKTSVAFIGSFASPHILKASARSRVPLSASCTESPENPNINRDVSDGVTFIRESGITTTPLLKAACEIAVSLVHVPVLRAVRLIPGSGIATSRCSLTRSFSSSASRSREARSLSLSRRRCAGKYPSLRKSETTRCWKVGGQCTGLRLIRGRVRTAVRAVFERNW